MKNKRQMIRPERNSVLTVFILTHTQAFIFPGMLFQYKISTHLRNLCGRRDKRLLFLWQKCKTQKKIVITWIKHILPRVHLCTSLKRSLLILCIIIWSKNLANYLQKGDAFLPSERTCNCICIRSLKIMRLKTTKFTL